MSEFKAPDGINFHCCDFASINVVAKDLCKIVAFLQGRAPYVTLRRFDDWWEHDGLHFPKGTIDFHGLFEIVGSPQSIYESVPGDDAVKIGVAPVDGSWYLRFYAVWDDSGELLEGDYDITLPLDDVEAFANDVVAGLGANIEEEPSGEYYKRIMVQ